MTEFAGKRVIVVGLGDTGFAAARALARLNAKVRVTESATSSVIEERASRLAADGIDVEIGGHDLETLDGDLAILSPGIPPHAPVVGALRGSGVDIISEVELAYRIAECDLLAITGTNGKTTTTTLLGSMLEEGGITTRVAGNIGFPLVDAVAEVGAGGAVAVELSSFQLATIDRFRAKVAVLLNIAEDHTDWHGSPDDYSSAKARIVENQTSDDVFVVNVDDPRAMAVAAKAPSLVVGFSARHPVPDGAGIAGRDIVYKGASVVAVDDVSLPGVAGLEDTLAATAAALEYGVDARAVARAIKGFAPLAHRLETVAEIDGVTFMDDSKATNPHATIAAVEGLESVVLIAGGRAKGIDLGALAETVPPVIAVVAIGESSDAVVETFSGLVPVERATSMSDAVRRAHRLARAGGSVLLSPACASLDMYENYAQRGDEFARAVRGLVEALRRGDDGGR